MNSIFRATRSRREHSPNFIAGCRAALVRTALSKVKPGFGRSFVLSMFGEEHSFHLGSPNIHRIAGARIWTKKN